MLHDVEVDETQHVLLILNKQIMQALACGAERAYHPSADSDSDDDYVAAHHDRAKKLRALREEYENLTVGYAPK